MLLIHGVRTKRTTTEMLFLEKTTLTSAYPTIYQLISRCYACIASTTWESYIVVTVHDIREGNIACDNEPETKNAKAYG